MHICVFAYFQPTPYSDFNLRWLYYFIRISEDMSWPTHPQIYMPNYVLRQCPLAQRAFSDLVPEDDIMSVPIMVKIWLSLGTKTTWLRLEKVLFLQHHQGKGKVKEMASEQQSPRSKSDVLLVHPTPPTSFGGLCCTITATHYSLSTQDKTRVIIPTASKGLWHLNIKLVALGHLFKDWCCRFP